MDEFKDDKKIETSEETTDSNIENSEENKKVDNAREDNSENKTEETGSETIESSEIEPETNKEVGKTTGSKEGEPEEGAKQESPTEENSQSKETEKSNKVTEPKDVETNSTTEEPGKTQDNSHDVKETQDLEPKATESSKDIAEPEETSETTEDESTNEPKTFEDASNSNEEAKDQPSETEERVKTPEEQEAEGRILPRIIEDEMKKSYLDYAMSVIVGRALPDVRDGLKPVHRRILYAMTELGLSSNKTFKKSARIVGEVLGKFHPHGDTAVYDSMVRMAQEFSLRYPLVKGQGNFGSIDGDSAAAMRYTEAKLQKISEEIIDDLDKETVKFVDNFDGSLKEPSVMPCKVPQLLINGSYGIAVGMATSIPPHNLNEVCNGVIKLIENPELAITELIEIITGPDFPTGGEILGNAGIRQAYATGRGIIKVRSKTNIEEVKGRKRIIVTEIPYQVNKAQTIEHIADLVKQKKITDISDLRDESDRDGIRVVIELKKDTNPEMVQNLLFKHSRLQTSFSIILIALVNNQPLTLNIKQILEEFLKHRQIVVRRRTEYTLRKAKEKFHILEGLIIALNNIDPIVELIKKSKNAEEARTGLMANYSLSEIQSQAILDMKLQKLAVLEQDKIKIEHGELKIKIEGLESILSDEQHIRDIIKAELEDLKKKYGDSRRTQILESDEEIDIEDLIKNEQVVVTVTRQGYTKRIPLETYKIQNKGGKGVIGADTKEEDTIEQLFVADTHSYLLTFTTKGKVHWLKVYQIPEARRQSMGKAFINLIPMDKDEKVSSIIPIKEFDKEHYLAMCTAKGLVKKTNLTEYSKPRKGGIIAINLKDEDKLVNVLLTDGTKNILLGSKNGLAVKFAEKDCRAVGRNAQGVRGIRLGTNDEVVGAVIAVDEKNLLTITENGYGKRTKISEYRLISRGGKGVINIRCSERNGSVASIKSVNDNDELMFVTKKGIIIRTQSNQISIIGRNTQGLRLMKMSSDDKVVAAAKIVHE